MNHRTVLLVAMIMLSIGHANANSERITPPATENGLSITLAVERTEIASGDSNRIIVTVKPTTNNTKHLRLRTYFFDVYGNQIYGWQIEIQGPDGDYRFPPVPGGIPPITDNFIITLNKKESYTVIIDLTRAILIQKKSLHKDVINIEPGRYSIKVSYDLDLENQLNLLDREDDIILGPIESNIAQYAVVEN